MICRKNVVIVIFIGIVGSLLKLFQTLQKRVKKFEPSFSLKKNVLRAWTKIFKSYNCVKLLKIYILKQLCFVSFSCCSYVGRHGGVQYLSLGFGCLRFGIVTHELGNAFSTFFFSHVWQDLRKFASASISWKWSLMPFVEIDAYYFCLFTYNFHHVFNSWLYV